MGNDEAIKTDIEWIKVMMKRAFLTLLSIFLAFGVGAVGVIYAAGQHTGQFNAHMEIDNIKHSNLDAKVQKTQELYIDVLEQRIRADLGDVDAESTLQDMREDWEKKKNPIVAKNEGEEA